MPNWQQGQSGGPPNQGDLWWNSSTGQLNVFNGANWLPLNPTDSEVPLSTGLITTAPDGTQTQGLGGAYISLITGSPTFTPNVVGSGNMAAHFFDPTTNRLWVYNPNSAAWKSVLLA